MKAETFSNPKEVIKSFVNKLTNAERTYLWDHVYRYSGVEGVPAAQQFQRLIEYVFNFLDGSSKMEKGIWNKALGML